MFYPVYTKKMFYPFVDPPRFFELLIIFWLKRIKKAKKSALKLKIGAKKERSFWFLDVFQIRDDVKTAVATIRFLKFV